MKNFLKNYFFSMKSVVIGAYLWVAAVPSVNACGGMAGGGCGGWLVVPFLLVALGAGYWVLTLSVSQDKPLAGFGRFIGGLIIIVGLVGLTWMAAKPFVCGKSGSCPMMGKGPMDCPAHKMMQPQI